MLRTARADERSPSLLGGAVFALVFLWLYFPVISGMAAAWLEDPNHSHGFLIPVVAGYIVWGRRRELRNTAVAPTDWGLLFLAGGVLMYVMGSLGAAHTTMRVSMLVALAGALIFLYGKAIFRKLLFPFFYLLFMIPMPSYLYDSIAFPLRLFVTKSSVAFIKLLGIPALREGNVIMLENLTLQVIDACSGIRSLTALAAVGVALSHVSRIGLGRKLLLVALVVPIAVSTNILRLVITGVLANKLGEGSAKGFFHEFAGLGVFALSILLLLGALYALQRGGKEGPGAGPRNPDGW